MGIKLESHIGTANNGMTPPPLDCERQSLRSCSRWTRTKPRRSERGFLTCGVHTSDLLSLSGGGNENL